MSLVIRTLHCYFIIYIYYYILGVHQLIDWLYLVYSPRLCEIWVLSAKSLDVAQLMCLIINHFVMYYSNLQVNYMVTVYIIAVVRLHLLSCSKCFVCLCLFQHRHRFLVGWCTNKSYSNLWLVTLHPCFQPASLNSPPHSPTFTLL